MDTLSNLLTSIRNAEMVRHTQLTVPAAKLSLAVLAILKAKKYVANFSANEAERTITISLPEPVQTHHYKRISKPGRRMYVNSHTIPTVMGGFGIAIISTSQGVLASSEARKRKVGGEILCEIY